MSTYNSVYVGAMILCKITLRYKMEPILGCKKCNRELDMYLSKLNSYCEKCGTKLEVVGEFKREIEIDTSNTSIKCGEKLISPEYAYPGDIHYYIPNMKTKAKLSSDLFSEEVSLLEIMPESKDICILALQSDFKEELNILKEEYGEDNVTIKFGCLAYSD